MWLGPAPERPFNPNRFHFNFRWFWDYAGGLMTDWGVHEIDIALYAMKATAPISVMASGGKLAYPDDASETPDTLQAVFQYDHFNMLWEHALGIDGGCYGRTEGIARATPYADAPSTLEALVADLDRLGFDPLVTDDPDDPDAAVVAFAHCPFADLAERHPELVCGLHRGLVAGFVAEMGDAEVGEFCTLTSRTPCRVTVASR